MSKISTINTILPKESSEGRGKPDPLGFLTGDEHTYAENLLTDWYALMLHMQKNKKKTCDLHKSNMMRLLIHANVPPWKLKKNHVTKFFESRISKITGETLSYATVAVYCSSFRSFQSFALELDRVNEIVRAFNIRPTEFITEENSISIKKAKSGWRPKSWALSEEQIDMVDKQFRYEIAVAYKTKSKSYHALLRDRVMFHISIHFSLRVSELVTIKLSDFHPHHDTRLRRKFGRWGTLAINGKTSGTVPMREKDIFSLLDWYVTEVRQIMLMKRKGKGNGISRFNEKDYVVSDLLFFSERGSVINPNTFRSRLNKISESLCLPNRLHPHVLRHTGCTLMVPLFTPEIAQKYMRHRWLSTTLTYYHSSPLVAGNEVNCAFAGLFDEHE